MIDVILLIKIGRWLIILKVQKWFLDIWRLLLNTVDGKYNIIL